MKRQLITVLVVLAVALHSPIVALAATSHAMTTNCQTAAPSDSDGPQKPCCKGQHKMSCCLLARCAAVGVTASPTPSARHHFHYLELEKSDGSLFRRAVHRRSGYRIGDRKAHRWNLDDAQANVFIWGGAGSATSSTFAGTRLDGNAGLQADYETRRIYASLKTDLQRSSEFSDRVDTLQLGLAPYKHDYNGLATWFVFQARHYTGQLHSGIETAALLRLFEGGAWVEAGITSDGKLQAMAMFNF